MFSCLFGNDIVKFVKKEEIDEYEDYSLDKKNIEKFINECDKEIKEIIKKLLENTKYISFIEFIQNLFTSIIDLNKFLIKNENKYIYIYECKCKCNKWMFKYIFRIIKYLNSNIKIKIIDNSFTKFKDNDFIILPFDCLSTGFLINKNTKILCNNNYNKNKIEIYVLSPYMSSYGIFNMKNRENEKKFNYKLHIGTHINIDKYLINEILTITEIRQLKEYYPDIIDDKISINYNNIYLLYFNYKLGDYTSTFTTLYMGLIPNKHNQALIKKIQFINTEIIRLKKINKIDKKKENQKMRNEMIKENIIQEEDIYKNLEIIPLIKNCKFIYNIFNIDTQNPICPPQII